MMKSNGENEVLKTETRDKHYPANSAGQKRGASRWIGPIVLLLGLLVVGGGLAAWKLNALKQAGAAAANHPEPAEAATLAVAKEHKHRRTTTSIGTVVALRSVKLRNELPGTVRTVNLTPGKIVETGTILVALDVSVEEAELKAQRAQVALAETVANRMEKAAQSRSVSAIEADQARAELDVARAQIERIQAVIARKTIRAPFRARIGISDIHPGQFLNEGTQITTLQGLDPATYVDFQLPQHIAQAVREGESVEVITTVGQQPVAAEIVALDALVDATTRNTMIRARVADAQTVPPPGSSVRVRVPAGDFLPGVTIPVSALRKGPAGDHVFVVAAGQDGKQRAKMRRVQVGASLGDEVLVVSGLSPGDTVAASGSFKLREGVLIASATPGAAAKN
jgi:membrane fusion protein, multidrug efflux system